MIYNRKGKKKAGRQEKSKAFNINHSICRIGHKDSCSINTFRDQRF
jgi:C1A family cysteine protease